jgi:hypothetical protein
MAVMGGLRARLPALDPRPRVGRLQARGMLALRFAVIGWRLGGARERLADRRTPIARLASSLTRLPKPCTGAPRAGEALGPSGVAHGPSSFETWRWARLGGSRRAAYTAVRLGVHVDPELEEY